MWKNCKNLGHSTKYFRVVEFELHSQNCNEFWNRYFLYSHLQAVINMNNQVANKKSERDIVLLFRKWDNKWLLIIIVKESSVKLRDR